MSNEPVALHAILILMIAMLTLLAYRLPSNLRLLKTPEWSTIRYLPLLSIPLYIIYEVTMPIDANIRIDIFLIYPMIYKCVSSSLQK